MPTSLMIVPGSASLAPGENTQLTAREYDQTGGTIANHQVSWSSTNTGVATVNAAGVVTAVAGGSATIRASVDNLQAQAGVAVTTVPAGSISITPTSATLTTGNSFQFSAVVKDAGGATLMNRIVSWTSSNTSVATVSTSGLATAVGAGGAIITATVDGISATASVAVSATATAPVASITVTLADAAIDVGQSTNAVAVLRDGEGNVLTGRTITWSSASASVATVSAVVL